MHFVVLNSFLRLKLKNCDRHKNSLANTLIKKLNIRRANRRMDFVDMFDMMEVVDIVGIVKLWNCGIVHSPYYGR